MADLEGQVYRAAGPDRLPVRGPEAGLGLGGGAVGDQNPEEPKHGRYQLVLRQNLARGHREGLRDAGRGILDVLVAVLDRVLSP